MKRILTAVLILALAFALTACGGTSAAPEATETPAEETAVADTAAAEESPAETAPEPITVRIGLTGAVYEPIWDVVKTELADEGINLEYIQFNNFSLPNNALSNGEIEMNAFQHHAFFNNDTGSNGYDLTAIGDTYIVAMDIFSDKIEDLSELKEGDLVAVPNDVTNGGRALKVLEAAGLIELNPEAGNLPTVNDITANPLNLKIQEVDANLVPSLIPDVSIAVVNGNYALDAGLKAEDALYKESEYADNSYYCLIAVRTEDAENPVYQRIVEAYQSDAVIDVYNNQFAGFFTPTWNLAAD